ncbi:OmpA family protein [Myxococcus faecalis]|uniref:OmpA family protein n=1 Tax=Myxococcus TaxID=32 RepID=UPI001CBD4749|nr:OmpA family protein [Myxococcus sp. AS-1-15]MBZ4395363.1 OmpA family protein [Myxococcus sp. AS-1-15]BDT30712.1 OmpA family protein [Myxococcus sp. MH1]
MAGSKHGWKALVGASALLVAGSASAAAPKELVEARAAYQQLAASPQGRERPRDVAEARDALRAAEREYQRDEKSQRTRVLSYVALRKAETAGAWGMADIAARQQAQAEVALNQAQALQEQQRLAQARQQEGELRLSEEAARRQQVEQEAQQLRAQNEELQRQAQLLQGQQQTQSQADQQAAQQLEAERQARVEAERQAAEAISKLDRANKDLKVREEARGTVLTLSGSVLFASGASDLLPVARDRLADVAQVLKEGDRPLLIEGHTDSQGSDALNERLSYQRAERVKEFLINQGVPANRIEARGMGEYRPVASNSTAEGRANNRRVEIILERGGSRAVGGSGQEQPGTGGSSSGGEQQQPGTGGSSSGDEQQQAPESGAVHDEDLGDVQQPGTGGSGDTSESGGQQDTSDDHHQFHGSGDGASQDVRQ